MSNLPSRCALYIRVSTAPQVEGNNLTTQKRQLLRYARAHGYDVVDVYADRGLSVKNMERPELQRLVKDAKAGVYEIVLASTVDRISRSLQDLVTLVELFRDHGVEFTAVEQQFDTSDPAGLFTLHVLGGASVSSSGN